MPEKKANSKKRTAKAASKSNGKSQNSEQPESAYLLSLTVENVRCFGSPAQTLDLSDGKGKPKQWTIILGDNGTGKTTLLQGLVSLSPEPVYESSSFSPDTSNFINSFPKLHGSYSLLNQWKPFRKSDNESFMELRFSLQKSLADSTILTNEELSFWVRGEDYWNRGKGTWFDIRINCFAYGASRKAGETSISDDDEESSYKTLFDETALLINPEEWLLRADYAVKRNSRSSSKRQQELNLIIEILKKILPDVDNVRSTERPSIGRIPKPIFEFHTHYGWVESKDLSLGYRTSMAWIVDFASRMFDLYPDTKNPLAEPAVVLIDEIDLHLHPKWQRDLIDYLTNLFPNTQFIVTTHSPLIVQAAAARDANLVVLRRDGDHVVIDQSIEALRGWRADQILTSDLFDLPSARPKETEELLEQRKQILSKAKLTKADEKKLKEISEKLGSLPVMENPEDDKAMDIIRRAAAHLQQEKR